MEHFIHRHIKSECPYCGYNMDSSSNFENDNKPKEGDVAICFSCTQPLLYNDDLTLREPNKEEELELNKDEYIQDLRKHLMKLDRENLHYE